MAEYNSQPKNRSKNKETNKLYFDSEKHSDELVLEKSKRKKKNVQTPMIVEPSPDAFEIRNNVSSNLYMPTVTPTKSTSSGRTNFVSTRQYVVAGVEGGRSSPSTTKEKKSQKKVRFDIPLDVDSEEGLEEATTNVEIKVEKKVEKKVRFDIPSDDEIEEVNENWQIQEPIRQSTIQKPIQQSTIQKPIQGPMIQSTIQPTIQPTIQSTIQPTIQQRASTTDIFGYFDFLSKKNAMTFSLSDLPIPPTNSTPVNNNGLWTTLSKSPSSSIYYDKEKNVIIKIFTTSQEFKKESWCLDKLKNYNFVPKIIATEKEHFILVMSYCGKKLTKANKPNNCYEQIKHIERVLALECIYHNDIETRNFVVDDQGKIYIIDFAISSLMHPTKPARNDFLPIFITLDCAPKINIDIEKCASIKENTQKHKKKIRNDGIVQTATQTLNSSISKNYINSSLHTDIKNSSAREFIGDKNVGNKKSQPPMSSKHMTFLKEQLLEKKKSNKSTAFTHSHVPKMNTPVIENKSPEELLNEFNAESSNFSHNVTNVANKPTSQVNKTIVRFQEEALSTKALKSDKHLNSKMKDQINKVKQQNKNSVKPKHKTKGSQKVTKIKPKQEIITSSFTFDSTPNLVKEIKYLNKFVSLNIVPKFIKSHLQSKTVYVDKLIPLHETDLPVDFENQLNELVQTLWRHKVHHNSITINKLFVDNSGHIVVTGFSDATKDNNCKTISPDKQRIQNIIVALKALAKTKQQKLSGKVLGELRPPSTPAMTSPIVLGGEVGGEVGEVGREVGKVVGKVVGKLVGKVVGGEVGGEVGRELERELDSEVGGEVGEQEVESEEGDQNNEAFHNVYEEVEEQNEYVQEDEVEVGEENNVDEEQNDEEEDVGEQNNVDEEQNEYVQEEGDEEEDVGEQNDEEEDVGEQNDEEEDVDEQNDEEEDVGEQNDEEEDVGEQNDEEEDVGEQNDEYEQNDDDEGEQNDDDEGEQNNDDEGEQNNDDDGDVQNNSVYEEVDDQYDEESEVDEEGGDEEGEHDQNSEDNIRVRFDDKNSIREEESDDKNDESKNDEYKHLTITKQSNRKKDDRFKEIYSRVNDFYDKKNIPPPRSSFKDLLSKYGNN
jgi:hypothetical protein